MKKVLLHICCGICAAGAVNRLREDNFEIIGYFYNPNIHPEEEYNLRLQAAKELASKMNFELIVGSYNKDSWFSLVKGLENEIEGGRRCQLCYKMRMQDTMNKAEDLSCSYFATTLSISPHKDAKIINEIGCFLSKDKFLEYDFKKQDGFKKANTLAKEYSLYRQHYCGCEFTREGR